MRLTLALLAAVAIACSASEREARSADSVPAATDTPVAGAAARYRGRTIDEWVAQLGDMDDSTRNAAEQVLVEIGAPAVPPLVTAASVRRPGVMRPVVALLAMCPAEAPLIRAELSRVRDERQLALLDTVARAVAFPDSFPTVGTPTRDKRGLPRVECLGRGVAP